METASGNTDLCMLLLFIMALAVPCRSMLANDETDERALLSFKALINGDPQGVLTSWVTGNSTGTTMNSSIVDVCGWQGVGCHSLRHPRRVTSLELTSCSLTGTVSPFLANLTFLRTLNISTNVLSGGIPWELGLLRRLSELDLGHNTLGGQIPSSLTSSSRLRALVLKDNGLVGEIPANLSHCRELQTFDVGVNHLSGRADPLLLSLASLPKLTELRLYSNNLVGTIPSSLGNLTSLVILSMGRNRLVGQIPDSFGQMTDLQYLHLAFNGLTGTFPRALLNISSIRMIQLSGNDQLSGVIPTDIGSALPNLEYLLLYSCQFKGRIPGSLGNASRLRMIELASNHLQGSVPLNFGYLRILEVLALERNQLLEAKWEKDWDLLASLANCTKLFALALSSKNFQGPFPPSIANLSAIKMMYLAHNSIHGQISPDIAKLVTLTSFQISGNFLTGTIPQTIGELHSLEVLELSGNNISGQIPPTIGNLTRLSRLSLSDNNLLGSIPASFERLARIASLDLSQNQLSGAIPKQLASLTSLTKSLDLAHNFLSGQIPLEVGSLINLVQLDFSKNELSGEIPSTLGNCIELVGLNLQDNLLIGVIPLSLSGLKGIQEIDLSGNNLTGQVPTFFDSLPFLVYMNLSYNNLDGPVPVRGIFSNATRFSVAGNKVCGGIPELHLPQCTFTISAKKHRPRRGMLISILVGAPTILVLLTYGICWWCSQRKQQRQSHTQPLVEDQHWQVSFIDLQTATNHFSRHNLIGIGSFGAVYRATLHGKEVAVKVLDLLQQGAEGSFLAECHALRSIRHRNLVKVMTVCSSVDHHGNDFKALVYEFMPNGDLDSWLHGSSIADQNGAPKMLTMLQRVNIAIDVAQALDYLHHHGQAPIVHCDLKPSNVLLDNDMVGHLGDFGLSRFADRRVGNSMEGPSTGTSVGIRGSIGYIAPEYGIGGEVSVEGDVYSYGVLLLEMFTGKRPTDVMFQGNNTLQVYVATNYPDRVIEIVDPTSLQPEQRKARSGDSSSRKCEDTKLHECTLTVFRIGLQCTEESSRTRMSIKDVIKELLIVREDFIR